MRREETMTCKGTRATIEPHMRELDMLVTLFRLGLAPIKSVEMVKAKLASYLPIGVSIDDVHKLFRTFSPASQEKILQQLWERDNAILSDPETTPFPTKKIVIPDD